MTLGSVDRSATQGIAIEVLNRVDANDKAFVQLMQSVDLNQPRQVQLLPFDPDHSYYNDQFTMMIAAVETTTVTLLHAPNFSVDTGL
jgi:hypothetical protein